MQSRLNSIVTICVCAARLSAANLPPHSPTITEPSVDGFVASAADLHMETGPFVDDNPGDTHVCSDWEIWTISPSAIVWQELCGTEVHRVHTHLGDGVFVNAYAGRSDLLPSTNYRLRVRHKDSSGDAATQWSAWAQRTFSTGAASQVFPLELSDIVDAPAPAWSDNSDVPIILPVAGTQPSLRIESATSQLLLQFAGFNGLSNQVTNPAELSDHVNIRVRINAGTVTTLSLPQSVVRFLDDHGSDHAIYLPSLNLSAGQSAYYWIGEDGASYVGTAGQTQPTFTTLARSSPIPWRARQPNFRIEIAATNFQLPVNIAFVPKPGSGLNDPFYYVTELYGTIKTVSRSGQVTDYATNLLNYNPTGAFPGSGEQGVAGIAVDPVSGDVFADMQYVSGASHYGKVVRFHSNDGGRTAATQTVILDLYPFAMSESHQISNLSIGYDGKLFIHVGDGFAFTNAQLLDTYLGKILRVNLNGTPVYDNPFYNNTNGITPLDYFYAYGFRNPFGGAWRVLDEKHYEVENGPEVDRFAQVVPGRNYLWDNTNLSMSYFALYNWTPANAPVNIVFIQPGTFGGSGFPFSKMDHAFVSESGPTYASGPQTKGKRISEFVLDGNGNRVSGPTALVEYTGSGRATAVGLAAGPDGLYFTELYKDQPTAGPTQRGANVLRIKYVGDPGNTDKDDDGVPDADDNCPLTPNPNQANIDGDAYGDACDSCPKTIPGMAVDFRGCSTPATGDFDRDGDIDISDFGIFQACQSGPQPITTECRPAALLPLNSFLNCMSGADIPAAAACGP